MEDLYGDQPTISYALSGDGVDNGKSQYKAFYGQYGWALDCEGTLYQTAGGGWKESVTCYGQEPKDTTKVKMRDDGYGPKPKDIVFQKGVTHEDQDYYYFAVASGRFGMRRSEYVSLEAEKFMKIDVSVRNGSAAKGRLEAKIFCNPWYAQGGTDPKGHDAQWEVIDLEGLGKWGNKKLRKRRYWHQVESFAGIVRDPNVCWENSWRTHINMSNNCESFAAVGMENYRGMTRTYRPPTQSNIRGTEADTASYFDYGKLYPFGTVLTQNDGDLLYGYQHLPKCRDWRLKNGRRGPRLGFFFKGNNIRHFTVKDPCIICENNPPGLKPRLLHHHGELYPWPEGDVNFSYGEGQYGFYAMGTAWQFSNLLGKIPRFGHYTEFPAIIKGAHMRTPVFTHHLGGIIKTQRMDLSQTIVEDTDDIFFWGGNQSVKLRNFNDAQGLIHRNTLAGENCGWCGYGERMGGTNSYGGSAGRFMLYFVEAHQRFYNRCKGGGKDALGKSFSRSLNYSFIAPGLRHGSSAIQYFWGGKPHNGYLKREPLYGPYAFEWKTMNHNRDRNGNGMSEAFASTKFNQEMRLYDPPAIYGLYLRQDRVYQQKVKNVRQWRNWAWGPGYSIKGWRYGRPGMKTGCGSVRLRCVEDRRETPGEIAAGYSNVTNPLDYANMTMLPNGQPEQTGTMGQKCLHYHYGKNLGIDPGRYYGCDNKQLLGGLCFDPCLSMKYNYGFFPGGKLLALNNYVKLKRSINPWQHGKAGSDAYVIQLSHNDNYQDVDLSYYKNTYPGGGGSRRIMRGPFATPYKLIRETIARKGKALSKGSYYDPVEDRDRPILDHGETIEGADQQGLDMPSWVHEDNNKYLHRRKANFIDTEVSPCNTRGADHCNYMTATLHMGLDVKVHGMEAQFNKYAAMIAGYFEMSKDPSTIEQVWGEIGRILMDGFNPGKESLVQLDDGNYVMMGPCSGSTAVTMGKGFCIFLFDSSGNLASVNPATDILSSFAQIFAGTGGQGVTQNQCFAQCASQFPNPLAGHAGMDSRQVEAAAQTAGRIAQTCMLDCQLAQALNNQDHICIRDSVIGKCVGADTSSTNQSDCENQSRGGGGGTWIPGSTEPEQVTVSCPKKSSSCADCTTSGGEWMVESLILSH
jgi:hypothetical protein